MKIKKGDNVIIIAGKDKGKTGVVERALPSRDLVLIGGVNMKKKHQKSRQSGKPGQIVEKNYPVHVSNVMIVDAKTKKQTRVGITRKEGKRTRVAKKSGQEV